MRGMNKNIPIQRLLPVVYGVLFLLLTAIFVMILVNSRRIREEFLDLSTYSTQKLELLSGLRKSAGYIQVATLRHAFTTGPHTESEQDHQVIAAEYADNGRRIARYYQLPMTAEERRLLDTLATKRLANTESRNRLIELSHQNPSEAVRYHDSVQYHTFEEWHNSITALTDLVEHSVAQKNNAMQSFLTLITSRIFLVLVIIVIILLLMGITIYRAIRIMGEQNRHLADRETRFRTIYEGSNDAIMLLDEKGFFDCNNETLKLFGVSDLDSFKKLHPADISPPVQPDGRDSMESANEKIKSALEKGHERFEWIHCRLHGENFPAEVLLSAFIFEGRKVLEATVRDISQRRQFTEALHNEKERFRNFIESSSDLIQSVDANGNIEFVNKAWQQTLGYSNDDIANLSVMEIIDEESRAHCMEQMQRVLNGERIENIDTVFTTKQGRKVYLEGSAAPWKQDDKVIGSQGFFRDVTERKKSEATLLRQSKLLSVTATIMFELLRKDSWETVLGDTFGIIGETLGVDRVYFFVSEKHPYTGIPSISQRVEWSRTHVTPQIDNPDFQYMPYSSAPDMMQSLLKGETYSGIASCMPEGAFRDMLIDHDILSLLIMPIFIKGNFYGFIGFDDCSCEREWTHDEISFLNTLNSNMAIAIEKKQWEQQLQESDAFSRGILSSLSSHIAVMSDDGSIIAVNKAWEDFAAANGSSSPAATGIGSNYFKVCERAAESGDLIAQQVLDGARNVIERKIDYFQLEYPCHAPDEERWFVAHIMPFGNRYDEIVMSHTNITERVLAEQLLKKSEAQLKEVSSSMPGVVYQFLIDANGVMSIPFISEGIVKMISVTQDDIYKDIGSLLAMVHPDDFNDFMKSIQTSAMEMSPWLYVFRSLDRDGVSRWIRGNSVPKALPDGGILWNGTLIDVSELKLSEFQLEDKNRELKKINEELDRFVYSTSHDLRSPLTSVLGLVNIIEEETTEDETRLHAGMIRTRIKRLDDFVQGILQYSRNSRLEIKPEKIPFETLIREIISNLEYMENASRIRFSIDVSVNDGFYSDYQRMSVVFANMISNAIKYHDFSKPDPKIALRVLADDDSASIIIEDNGTGIDPVHFPKLFDMFYRVSSAIPGTGLGLYLVKEIIDKLHGSVKVDSKPGIGTRFTITLHNLIHQQAKAS